jgi:hypothetical protein
LAKRCVNGDGGGAPVANRPPLYYRVHDLLHTVRAIGQQEDQLCGLLHALQTADSIAPEVDAELRAVLESMPLFAYQQELQAAWQTLGAAPSARRAAARRSHKTAARSRKANPRTVPVKSKARVKTARKTALQVTATSARNGVAGKRVAKAAAKKAARKTVARKTAGRSRR